VIFAPLMAVLLAAASPAPADSPTPAASSTPSPNRLLVLVRSKFRSHRPPPPYETYTIVRSQLMDTGFPDYVNSYTYHVWERNLDRAALGRKVFRDTARGPLEFMRPAFNEARDPGPPTADVFEPAPVRPHPIEFVPTPEPAPTDLQVIGQVVTAIGDYDYEVTNVSYEGDLLHLTVKPRRDPQRNRLREVYADKETLELRKLIATDRLFVGNQVFGVTFTITMGNVDGYPVVTDIHGVVGDNYRGDGQEIDYRFRDITFPTTLPSWYFDKRAYGGHDGTDAPL
jgi:hypothetical protein